MAEQVSIEESTPYRVLCLDGGGMRGLYTAAVLEKLVQMKAPHLAGKPADLGKAFNLICGTSTGAILACSLAAGLSLESVQQLYIDNGMSIFPDPFPKRRGWWLEYPWAFRNRKSPAGNVAPLKMALEAAFGQETLAALYARRQIGLCIPAVRATNFKCIIFKTPHQDDFDRDKTLPLVDVCLASGAAPIYLPLHQIKLAGSQLDQEIFLDGGLWANNPILVGLVEALQVAAPSRPIEILSVGTCDEPSGDPSMQQNTAWGLKQWKVGIGVTEASLSAQSNGHFNIANLMAGFLRQAGRQVSLVRLEETNKSVGHYSAMGLDRADPTAILTMKQLAQVDAEKAASYMKTKVEDKSWDFVRDIFSTLSPIQEPDHA